MTATTAPTLAEPTITPDGEFLTVAVSWKPQPGLDRLDARAWAVHNTPAGRKLADRLVRAIKAGAIITPSEPFTDALGKRGWHANSGILGRTLNADLRRIGY